MSLDLYEDLAWLPRAPADLRARCRRLTEEEDGPLGAAIAALARHALDENSLRRVADVVARARALGRSLEPLTPFRLAVVGNATLDPLVPALVATAARHGIALDVVAGGFGQTMQEALSPDSPTARSRPDAVLVAVDHRGLPLLSADHERPSADAAVGGALAWLARARDGFRMNAGAPCIVQTLAPPPESLFGSLDRLVPGTLRDAVGAFNAALTLDVAASHDVLLDIAAVAETVGLARWHSPAQWNLAKLAFDVRFLPLYADHVCRLIAAMRGKSRRVLVLDLDNTLWGGVVGDDGLEGIAIGQGDATGEAFLEVQRLALALRARGIVLAVSSKNDDAIARSPFARHPDMVLREPHIAVFQANWHDKATNVVAIARELALGLDAVVFLDDNPVERNLVREALPDVAVPELPDDPALYARTLAAAGYFESVAFSVEDRRRAAFYEGNARRAALAAQVTDMDAYLRSLRMTISFAPFDAAGRARIAQLIAKSNQFNLTTRRYGEAQVAAFERDPDVVTLQVRLADAFGDNGMIGVLIARPAGGTTLEIDTWLMSCRVLGRGVERAVLAELLRQARERGFTRLRGRYVPTPKNGLVREHYATLGFARVASDETGASTWERSVDADVPAPAMDVDRTAFEPRSTLVR